MVIVALVLYVNHTSACGGLLGMVRVLSQSPTSEYAIVPIEVVNEMQEQTKWY